MAFGITEGALIIGAIIALIWGPKQLPKLAKALGKAKKEFTKGTK